MITTDNNNDNYDSDNTVLLEQEITDVISEGPIPGDGLLVETTNCDETQEITDQLSDLSVNIQQRAATIAKTDNLPVETTDPPISPNKGKVVICSYKLQWTIPTTTESVRNQTSDLNNTENEIQHPKVPSGNATRPPPPNKYKIRKFQIDKVKYYSCMYCNKHFESIHYLNKHHVKHHPPVSCDMCNRIFDMPNSVIWHSYRHLDGKFGCKDCKESFHFKSELDCHSMKLSKERLQCKKCDKSFIRNSDLNTHINTHGKKWKCEYPSCTKECADKRYLTTHMKVHSAELKYACRKCKKWFRFYEQRKRHEADHP